MINEIDKLLISLAALLQEDYVPSWERGRGDEPPGGGDEDADDTDDTDDTDDGPHKGVPVDHTLSHVPKNSEYAAMAEKAKGIVINILQNPKASISDKKTAEGDIYNMYVHPVAGHIDNRARKYSYDIDNPRSEEIHARTKQIIEDQIWERMLWKDHILEKSYNPEKAEVLQYIFGYLNQVMRSYTREYEKIKKELYQLASPVGGDDEGGNIEKSGLQSISHLATQTARVAKASKTAHNLSLEEMEVVHEVMDFLQKAASNHALLPGIRPGNAKEYIEIFTKAHGLGTPKKQDAQLAIEYGFSKRNVGLIIGRMMTSIKAHFKSAAELEASQNTELDATDKKKFVATKLAAIDTSFAGDKLGRKVATDHALVVEELLRRLTELLREWNNDITDTGHGQEAVS